MSATTDAVPRETLGEYAPLLALFPGHATVTAASVEALLTAGHAERARALLHASAAPLVTLLLVPALRQLRRDLDLPPAHRIPLPSVIDVFTKCADPGPAIAHFLRAELGPAAARSPLDPLLDALGVERGGKGL